MDKYPEPYTPHKTESPDGGDGDAKDIMLELALRKRSIALSEDAAKAIYEDTECTFVTERDPNLQLQKRTRKGSTVSKNVLRGRMDLVSKAQSNQVSVTSGSSHGGSGFTTMDSFRTFEKAKHPRCCICVKMINPLSLCHSVWDLSVAVILVVSLITLPLGMAFDDIAESLFVANLIFDAVFAMDIAVTFCTGFIDANDVLIMQPSMVAKNYFASWFLLDVVSSVPIDAILRIVEESQRGQQADGTDMARLTKTFKMVRLVRMAKLVRLFRLSRVAKYVRSARLWLEHHLKFEMPMAVIKVSKLLVLLCFLGHWLGCVFFFIPKQFDFPYNSWVVQGGISDLSTGKQYTWSLFKALYMMIGGEEMLPSGNSIGCEDTSEYCLVESWMTLLSLYLGATFSALLISEVGLIVTSLDKSRQLFHDRLNSVNEYMRANKLSPELREHVREYFSLRYSDQKMFQEDAILRDLSPNLQVRIREEMSHNIIERVPLLHDQAENHAFIDNLVTKLRGPLICFPQEVIFYEGTMGHSMYFIYSGVVGIYSEHAVTEDEEDPEMQTTMGSIIAAISNGCYFGEVAMLMKCRRTATARSETITVLHTLSEDALDICLDDAPEVREYMMNVAKTRKQRVDQISPHFTGIVDVKLEANDYLDKEDARTQLFQFENSKVVSRRFSRRKRTSGTADVRSSGGGDDRSSGGITSPSRKGGSERKRRKSKLFQFDKSSVQEKRADESLKALWRATSKAVSAASSRRRSSFKDIVGAKNESVSKESVRNDFLKALSLHPEVLEIDDKEEKRNSVVEPELGGSRVKNEGKQQALRVATEADGTERNEVGGDQDECTLTATSIERSHTPLEVVGNHTVKHDYF